MRFTVLGAGMMGCATVYDLACSKRVAEIVVGDFDLPRAEEVARKYGGGKARAEFVDVRKPEETVKLLAGSEAVLNCTQYYWNLAVMKAALEARVNYLDLGGLFTRRGSSWRWIRSSRGSGSWRYWELGARRGLRM